MQASRQEIAPLMVAVGVAASKLLLTERQYQIELVRWSEFPDKPLPNRDGVKNARYNFNSACAASTAAALALVEQRDAWEARALAAEASLANENPPDLEEHHDNCLWSAWLCHPECPRAEIHRDCVPEWIAVERDAARATIGEMRRLGDDVAAALSATMEADALDAEGIDHCNYVIDKWVELVQPEAVK